MSRQQEMLTDKFTTDSAHSLALVGVAQQVANAVSGAFRRMHEKAGVIIVDLQRDSTASAANDRFSFPQGFGDGQPKSLLNGLLQNNDGRPLQSIDGPMGIRTQEHDLEVGALAGPILDFAKTSASFGSRRSRPARLT